MSTAVRNASLTRISQNNKMQAIDENTMVYVESISAEDNELSLRKKRKLYSQIDLLPEQCKKVFILCVVDGLKYQETANQLGLSINTVKTQMKKAFKMLRASLKEIYFLILIAANEVFIKKNKNTSP